MAFSTIYTLPPKLSLQSCSLSRTPNLLDTFRERPHRPLRLNAYETDTWFFSPNPFLPEFSHFSKSDHYHSVAQAKITVGSSLSLTPHLHSSANLTVSYLQNIAQTLHFSLSLLLSPDSESPSFSPGSHQIHHNCSFSAPTFAPSKTNCKAVFRLAKVSPSTWLFFKIALAILVPLHVLIYFRMNLLHTHTHTPICWCFDWDGFGPIYWFSHNRHLNNMEFSSPWIQSISPSI